MSIAWLALLLSLAAPLTAQQIAVRGEAKLRQPADEVSLSLGVLTEGKTPQEALSANGEKIQILLDALKSTGVSSEEYETGMFSLTPLYTQRPARATGNWEPTLRGYRVENRLTLRTAKISQIGSWIDTAVQKGANFAGELSFSLHDPEKARKEAIEKATADALAKGALLAKSASVEVGKVVSLSLDGVQPQPPPEFAHLAMMRYQGASSQTAIVNGTVEVSAEVTAVFEILH